MCGNQPCNQRYVSDWPNSFSGSWVDFGLVSYGFRKNKPSIIPKNSVSTLDPGAQCMSLDNSA